MSNYLAIAAVTAVLSNILKKAIIDAEISDSTVTTLRPDEPKNGTHEPGVNIYLYQVTHNAARRNNDLPIRDNAGVVVTRPQAALELSYLLTCYGDDNKLKPQQLLGLVIRTLHSRPLLTREIIKQYIDTIEPGTVHDFLMQSDLAEQLESIRFSSTLYNLEELSKLWSVFFQTPYTLSVAYQASAVLIDSTESPRIALPVRERAVQGTTIQRPAIDKVLVQKADADEPTLNEPVEIGDWIIFIGRRLRGNSTILRFDDYEIDSNQFQEFEDTRLKFKLDASVFPDEALVVGKHKLQVVHQFDLGNPPTAHKIFESNMVYLVLRPSIESTLGH
jgi:hypothetical protein